MIELDLERAVVFDVETTMRGPGKDPSPFYKENQLVLSGAYLPLTDEYSLWRESAHDVVWFDSVPSTTMMIGHNLSFDLHWLFRERPEMQAYMGKFVRIWDTQLAHFILIGQTKPFPSLNDAAARYELGSKDTTVSDLWAAGVDTMDIDPTVLAKYLQRDLSLTYEVFKQQVVEATSRGMLTLIMQQMEALQATIDMTFNGVAVNEPLLRVLAHTLEAEMKDDRAHIVAIASSLGFPAGEFNPASPAQLADALYGGEIEIVEQEVAGHYKTGPNKGSPKYRKVTKKVVIPGLALPITKLTPSGARATDEAQLLDLLADCAPGSVSGAFLERMIRYRNNAKQLNTYALGLPTHIRHDDLIHHELNHCVARTGRLSSSKPNLQNVTNGPVKEAFVPHLGYDYLVEHDFNQLEMIALAVISNDPVLIEDIANGRDMHTYFYTKIYGHAPTKEQRTQFKRLMFGLVYGAGAKKLAVTSKLPVAVCESFISFFYERYAGVKAYHDTLIVEAARLGRYTPTSRDKKGNPIKVYTHPSLTGRQYVFQEFEIPWQKGKFGFSPTELKNRPIQGWATADIVPLAIGLLYRYVYGNLEGVKLINTVHDSIVSMVKGSEEKARAWANMGRQVLESVKEAYERAYKFVIPLPLKVGASVGLNWLHMEEIDRVTMEGVGLKELETTWLSHVE